MARSSAGPAPSSGSPTPSGPIRPGALSRAQQPAPKGAMQSGAAVVDRDSQRQTESGNENREDDRGRSTGRPDWQPKGTVSDDEDAIAPLPRPGAVARTDSMDRRQQRSSSRDSSLARRLSAGLSGVLRGRSASVERSETGLSRTGTDTSTLQGELNLQFFDVVKCLAGREERRRTIQNCGLVSSAQASGRSLHQTCRTWRGDKTG